MKTRERQNKMYWAGYCDATIRQAATTEDDSTGRDQRMKWAQSHFNNCGQCKLAAIVKALESEAGAAASHAGIEHHIAFQDVLRKAITRGVVPPRVDVWITKLIARQGKDWPGHTETSA